MTKSNRNGMTRRHLLGLGGAAAGAALVGGITLPSHPMEAQAAQEPPLPQVPRRTLGNTGKTVPILLVGGMGLDKKFDPKLAEAVRFGVNYVDAADCYLGGRSEAGLADYFARAKNRDKVWVTSKSDKHDPKAFEQTVFRSLEQLQSDYVDMYYLHALKDADYLNEDLAVTVSRLKKAGKIRHFGFSCHDGNVAELLHKAAKTPWVESVMFRYNFRSYGNKELNAAIDAAHTAGVGLIAMKTQGSEAGLRDAWQKFEKTGRWTKHQAVLKAVWADERISAAVSHMDSFEKLRENIAAALDRSTLTAAEKEALDRYAQATRPWACDGCDHLCSAAVAANVQIGDTMRFLMYHDAYGESGKARDLFAKLPAEARALAQVDFTPANRACPHGVDVAGLMKRAEEVLA
ncbi:MAG TPA: aldo/keto reductase [Thermoanaerobaculia bacterium]|nr:aldo/keto reductase [Thermoanaerobaculia bacterium]